MYTMTCDGHPLLDVRDEDYILQNPKIKLKDNAVGEGSFNIFAIHPNYDRLSMLKSIFEVSDEYGTIFRGRMTENTKDIRRGKAVDLEGVMAFFNDSVVRPYKFPHDFVLNSQYQAAAAESPEQAAIDGGVVRFYVQMLIDQHNEQVEPFQQFKLGRVTVYDKNNYITRESSDYPHTWEEIEEKLFNSSLGGHWCIRYEADGNYIDYLREFTEVNPQGITYGENLRDFSQSANGLETYTAIIPRGKNGLTIKALEDGEVPGHPDIRKKGDMLYSTSAVASYGLRIAPPSETMWEDVTKAENLRNNGISFLEGDATKVPDTIECKAVDLHCTDSEIRSFRMYKKIPVYVGPHGINSEFDLASLDIDLLNPQNTDISVGKKTMTLTDIQQKQQSAIKVQQVVNQTTSNTTAETTEIVQKLNTRIVAIEANETVTGVSIDEITGAVTLTFKTADQPFSKNLNTYENYKLTVDQQNADYNTTCESVNAANAAIVAIAERVATLESGSGGDGPGPSTAGGLHLKDIVQRN